MNIRLVGDAEHQYPRLSKSLRKKVDKQFRYLTENISHSSLDVKKYDKNINLYQGRIDHKYRFYFFIKNPEYVVISIINHPK